MHSVPFLRTWHIVFAGFLQTCGTANGMIGLWRDLLQYASPETVVQFRCWNDNVDDLAESIWRQAQNDDVVPAIYVYAYSRGGSTAMDFARALGERGLSIRRMVLSDPVYWRGCALRRAWQALNPYSVIRVPGSVDEVDWFRQTLRWPRGHDLVTEDSGVYRACIHEPFVVPDVSHQYMDDLPAFRERCLQVAEMAKAA
jgi:hypothetical protein